VKLADLTSISFGWIYFCSIPRRVAQHLIEFEIGSETQGTFLHSVTRHNNIALLATVGFDYLVSNNYEVYLTVLLRTDRDATTTEEQQHSENATPHSQRENGSV